MVEVEGTVNIKTAITVKEAIESLYRECIENGKNETDKTDERTEKIFDAIDCLRNNYEYIMSTIFKDMPNSMKIDGLLTTSAQMNSFNTSISIDSVKALYALSMRFYTLIKTKSEKGVDIKYFSPYVESLGSEFVMRAEKVKSALEYLNQNYYYYINEINSDIQKQLDIPSEVLGDSIFMNCWDLLGIPMYSPLIVIKEAYLIKYDLIEESLIRGENEYTPKSLVELNKALYVLSNSRLKYVYNCMITGKKPIESERKAAAKEDENDLDYDLDLDERLLSHMIKRTGIYNASEKVIYNTVKIDSKTLEELKKWLGDNRSILYKKVENKRESSNRFERW